MINTAHFSTEELLALLGPNTQAEAPSNCTGISTDSRTIQKGNLYIPLRGEQFDGHAFIDKAIESGAAGIIIESQIFHSLSTEIQHYPHIVVDNTLHALGILAHHHRKRFDIPVIAVAGAAGKTSTKDCITHVLGTRKNVLKTQANFNNQIGVPLMLLQLHEDHEAAVIEIGTNEPGEIAILSAILAPTHGLITNIGKEHLEKLIDLDGVEKEETALFEWLDHHGCIRLINVSDERLSKYAKGMKYLTYGIDADADISATFSLNEHGFAHITLQQQFGKQEALLTIPGKVGALTAIASAAVGIACGISLKEIAVALSNYVPPVYHGYGRMAMQTINDIMVLNDSYNANPASMMTALETLQNVQCEGRKIAVLGDMRELGEASFSEHVHLLNILGDYCDIAIVTGQEFKKALDEIKTVSNSIHFAENTDTCAEQLQALAKHSDIVLVKGSRGLQLENVLSRWQEILQKS